MKFGSTLQDSPTIDSSFGDPVLTHICEEPDGAVERYVYPLTLSLASLDRFYERAKHHRVLFVDDIHGDFKKFCEIFMSQEPDGSLRAHGLLWVIDDYVGMFYMTRITAHEALVHFTFFDGRFRGRVDFTREMLKFVFQKYGFRRLNVEVGYFAAKYVFGFVEAIGFRREGRKRKSILYRGDWFDLAYYGLLREEILPNAKPNT